MSPPLSIPNLERFHEHLRRMWHGLTLVDTAEIFSPFGFDRAFTEHCEKEVRLSVLRKALDESLMPITPTTVEWTFVPRRDLVLDTARARPIEDPRDTTLTSEDHQRGVCVLAAWAWAVPAYTNWNEEAITMTRHMYRRPGFEAL